MDDKQSVRARVREQRAARTNEEVGRAGAALARRLADLWSDLLREEPTRPPVVAAYLSTGSEPPTWPLVELLGERGLDVLVPIVTGDRLDWAHYAGESATAANRLGIREPTGSRLGEQAVAGAGLVVVPGLAVDRAGHRLGRGGGYYDRALTHVTGHVPRAVVLYDDEVLEAVPYAAHDQRVGVAVTPSRTLWLD